jgi:hypothetical protein
LRVFEEQALELVSQDLPVGIARQHAEREQYLRRHLECREPLGDEAAQFVFASVMPGRSVTTAPGSSPSE